MNDEFGQMVEDSRPASVFQVDFAVSRQVNRSIVRCGNCSRPVVDVDLEFVMTDDDFVEVCQRCVEVLS